MIPYLPSPSVCVIDDEEQDYRPILDALLNLGLGCVHVRGNTGSPLPPRPFRGLQIIFVDLHLSGQTGKAAAAHTANVFLRVVSPETAPLLVVIWSKYANDPGGNVDLPPEDQPTEADLFKEAIRGAEPRFVNRLIFTEMPKPKAPDRPALETWIETLKTDIQRALEGYDACDVLWTWEALVRDAGITLCEELTNLALGEVTPGTGPSFDERLKLILRLLAREQGGPDCSATTAPRHVATVLGHSLIDQMEHSVDLDTLSRHGVWMADGRLPATTDYSSKLNGLLLTAAAQAGGPPFIPGTIYRLSQLEKFKEVFGADFGELSFYCYNNLKEKSVWAKDKWMHEVKHVFIELSPACDFHQSTRRQALLVAGLLVPSEGRPHAKRGDATETLPIFSLRWPTEGFCEQDAFLIFCSRYKMTLPHGREPDWLVPWFRLRELPTASLRNWHSGHSSRIGYVSFR